jgi:hypothetical protein
MNKLMPFAISLALVGLVLGGCGLDELQSGEAFRTAFPDEATLTIQNQELNQSESRLSSQSQALVGDRADLHDLSFLVAFQINRHARDILETVWFITRFQPSFAVAEQGVIGEPGEEFSYDARAIWGPFRDDEGKNLEFILHVWRGVDAQDGRRTFLYFIAGRPVGGTDDDWIVFLVGGSKPFEGQPDQMGVVELDMNAIGLLDPTEDDVGVFSFVYYQEADNHAVAATGEGVWNDETQSQTTDVNYFYGQSSQGYAVLEFDTNGDLEDDAGDALEHLHVTTGWLYNGDGRSDAVVTGGDLGAATAVLAECWGADLRQDYFLFATDGLDPDVAAEDGEVSACFTGQPIDLPEIDYDAIRRAFD